MRESTGGKANRNTQQHLENSVGVGDISDHREDEMSDDLREIDRKVNEINREIERLEMEVRDCEVLRRQESEDKARLRVDAEEKLNIENKPFQRISDERELIKTESTEVQAVRGNREDVLRKEIQDMRKKHEERENQKEMKDRYVEEFIYNGKGQ
ncbi:hypothetical protein BIW11_13741 [Tropilaelaps mercedesae]|uniref:Uncharacterized protein n=1 Tax=Tropilaelaps mercedesae TaxID=418985 RepID=A0A1V9X0U4_9ACAR|nr:hypothetical protein BIW11_13741 [Tropilaelaps mercedesae]